MPGGLKLVEFNATLFNSGQFLEKCPAQWQLKQSPSDLCLSCSSLLSLDLGPDFLGLISNLTNFLTVWKCLMCLEVPDLSDSVWNQTH